MGWWVDALRARNGRETKPKRKKSCLIGKGNNNKQIITNEGGEKLVSVSHGLVQVYFLREPALWTTVICTISNLHFSQVKIVGDIDFTTFQSVLALSSPYLRERGIIPKILMEITVA